MLRKETLTSKIPVNESVVAFFGLNLSYVQLQRFYLEEKSNKEKLLNNMRQYITDRELSRTRELWKVCKHGNE